MLRAYTTRRRVAFCPPRSSNSSTRGFTLVELLVTVAVAAVLVAIAAPSFSAIINSNRLAASSNDMIGALQAARLESMRRGKQVYICASTDGLTCKTDSAQWTGWIMYADLDGNKNPSASEVLRFEKVSEPTELWASPAISGNDNKVRFRPDGFAYDKSNVLLAANFSACIPGKGMPDNARDVGVGAGSRFEVDKRTTKDGACAAPANP